MEKRYENKPEGFIPRHKVRYTVTTVYELETSHENTEDVLPEVEHCLEYVGLEGPDDVIISKEIEIGEVTKIK